MHLTRISAVFSRLHVVIVALACGVGAGSAPAQQAASQADGAALLQAGKAAEARDAFEAALSAEPNNAEAQAGEVAASEHLALEARAAGKMNDALQTLLRAQQFAPHNARLLFDLGILEDQMRLFTDADKSLAAAEQLNPGDPNILYGLARVKMDLGQLAPAEEKMQAYLKLRPNDASAHYGLGRIYQVGLQFDKAQAEFARSVELQPVQTESYFELGDLALKQGDFGEAIKQFSKTLERDPKHGGALEGTGEAYFRQKHYDQAKDFLERAIAAAPDYAPCHYYLGLTLARLGRKEDSERELATAAKQADAENKNSATHMQLTPAAKP
ncbi:MAG: tetratricopeptide repeat protein [Acidobacteriota bacterium]|nr:tetratricopeptide repeat protein [Acidobacteriota bacterium]